MIKPGNTTYDIAIVGAGGVGLCMALGLAIENFNVLVIDQGPPPTDSYSGKYHAISPRVYQGLIKMGLKDEKHAFSPFSKMFVFQNQIKNALTFDAKTVHLPSLGYLVSNFSLLDILHQKTAQQTKIKVSYDESLQSLKVHEDHVILKTKSQTFKSKLVIGADGAKSKVRALLNILCDTKDFEQIAMVGNVVTSKPHEQTAYQKFLNTGPMAFLPLLDPMQSSMVWTMDKAFAQSLINMPLELIHHEIMQNFDSSLLGNIELQQKPQTFEIIQQMAQRWALNRVVLIGDAAHVVHPLAGQGANLGFLDAFFLIEVLSKAKIQNYDWGLIAILNQYVSVRRPEVKLMMQCFDKINWYFSKTQLTELTSLGSKLINNCSWIKNFLINQAMGYALNQQTAAY